MHRAAIPRYMAGMNQPGPFDLNTDPRLLYLTPALRTALHKIRYVVERRQGITTVLGDFGLGKSTVLRKIFGEFRVREDVAAVLIGTPKYKTDYSFLRDICAEFGLPPRRSLTEQHRELERFAGEQYLAGRNVLLMIDEGQLLDAKQLEVLRALVNFETNERKLLQVILAGQLELRDRLLERKFGALRSRIFAPTLLSPLSLLETSEMLAFRCAEAQIRNPFPEPTIEALYEHTAGIPREILKVAAMAYELMRLASDETIPPDAIPAAAAEATMNRPLEAEAAR